MGIATNTKQHQWKLLTMTDVIVIGSDPDSGEPIGVAIDDTREGVNCGNCGVPWHEGADEIECEDDDTD